MTLLMNFWLLAVFCDCLAPASEDQAFCTLRCNEGTLYSVYKERQVADTAELLLLILHMASDTSCTRAPVNRSELRVNMLFPLMCLFRLKVKSK